MKKGQTKKLVLQKVEISKLNNLTSIKGGGPLDSDGCQSLLGDDCPGTASQPGTGFAICDDVIVK